MDLHNLSLIHGPSSDQALFEESTSFPALYFLSLLQSKPLEAKALLEDGVAQGTVVFPFGTNDLEFDSVFRNSLTLHNGSGPDIQLCQQRYGLEPVEAVHQMDSFPYTYCLQLLDRLAAGTPPLFYHWAVGFLHEFLDPRAADWEYDRLVDYPTPEQ